MRSTLVIKCVLFSVILNGAAVASAQVTSLSSENSRISNISDKSRPQLVAALEEQAGGASLTFGKGLGLPSLITDIYFDDAHSAKFNNVTHHADSSVGVSVNSSSSDGLMAVVDNKPFKIDSTVQDKSLVEVSDIIQPNAVPLPAAAWLFSSALLGFIVVANRRKI
ncbi:VPLPA-CTERM sorting domain-containing protein [Pseudomonas sp. Ma2-10]